MKQTTFTPVSRRSWNIRAALLCAAGIAVNLLLGEAAGRLGLPLYLDTVGTVVCAAAGGYLPAVIVGFATNMLKAVSDPSSMYYGVLNVLISVAAAWTAKRGWFRKFQGIIGIILVFTFIGGGIGALIPWYMDELTFDSESLSGVLYETGWFGQGVSHLLASLIMDLLDKTVSVLLVLGILRLIPKRIHPWFCFDGWMQTPLTDEETDAARSMKTRGMSLRPKILVVLSVSLVSVSVAATVISVLLYRHTLIRDRTELAKGTAVLAASMMDGNRVDVYLRRAEHASGFRETRTILQNICESSPDVACLYVFQLREDGCSVVFDVEGRKTGLEEPGSITLDTAIASCRDAMLAGEAIEPISTNDENGWRLTALHPVYDAQGKCACYVGADVDMDQITAVERSFLAEMLSLFLGIFVLIYVFINWMVEHHIILPVNSIATTTGAFAYDNEDSRASSIQHIHELNIHTGDEVEALYHAIVKTSDDTQVYIQDVREKTAEMEQMQSALIVVLADIVESRDRNTGAHVRKTAAYAGIILRSMRRKGYYADRLTDDYIADVVHSAPLHDVGKIQVPDAILNKPGKLTDEEFEIMKTHTTAGQAIITEAIELVPHPGYLEEARNLAAYHHEKWNGKGYPYGLAGEEIPLSARVMAVADVFDALVSKRSYKQPFPFEEAMQIIKDGSGTHFDPKIVDAFAAAEDEVRQVEQQFSQMTDDSGCFQDS